MRILILAVLATSVWGGGPQLLAPGQISTAAYETTPAFTPSGDAAFFMRFSVATERPSIHMATRSGDGWSSASIPAFLEGLHAAGPAMLPDGSKLFFWVLQGNQPPRLRYCERTPSGWSQPREAGKEIEGEGGELAPSLSAAGTLYFIATRPNGKGGQDIYRSRLVDGKYRAPENLGDGVNTTFDETGAGISPDEKMLIIASRDRPDGRGEGDLYLSVEENGKWRAAAPLGPEINTEADESCPQFSPDGRELYFTRDGDVYHVPVAQLLRPAAANWGRRANAPSRRLWSRAVPMNGRLYVMGGLSGWGEGSGPLHTFEEYDPRSDSWRARAALPGGMFMAPAAVVDGRLMLFNAGIEGFAYVYDPAKDAWAIEPGPRFPWLSDPSTFVREVDGHLVAFRSRWAGSFHAALAEFDRAGREWVARPSPPTGTQNGDVAMLNGRLYVTGGGGSGHALYEYDPGARRWTRKTPMPTGRVESRAAAFGGKLYVFGGHNFYGAALDTVEVYDPGTNTWARLPGMPQPLWGVAPAEIGGRLLVVGGGPDAINSRAAENSVWEFEP